MWITMIEAQYVVITVQADMNLIVVCYSLLRR